MRICRRVYYQIVLKKSNATRKSRGDKFFSKDTVTKSHSVEANIKRKESYRNTAGKYQLSDGFIGTSGQIAEHLNCSNTYASVYCRNSLINDVTITRGRFKGLTFKKFKEGSLRLGSARINEWRDDKNPEDCQLQEEQIRYDR